MFSKKDFKEFIIKYGKKWLFPDFTNKLTWFVVSIGGAILLTPTLLKQIIYNWLIETINLNSGVPITLAELESGSADYVIGLSLIVLALAHNVANRYFLYKESAPARKETEALAEVDRKLFLRFLEEFPSDCRSIDLLQNHDFGNSYHEIKTQELDNFVNYWNTAEREFLDSEIEEKRKEFWDKCHTLVYDLAQGSYYLGAGPMLSCIPDAYRGEWDWPEHVEKKIKHLNSRSTECFNLHRELVLLGRRKLKC